MKLDLIVSHKLNAFLYKMKEYRRENSIKIKGHIKIKMMFRQQ